jgi:hypothetical protein
MKQSSGRGTFMSFYMLCLKQALCSLRSGSVLVTLEY